ncbi:uncharacterized protein LOC116019860 isoform X1 [Ipomoea triloba]|uniref:uncharacterized protein LOC116019860 isoform X1 n=2 Tax=Ipomoea triloba TaxID=35885 RepID=UPI00125DC565|nr:uncharacterized protein LOC116019860 isoform X1 [Ipomoea triloba]
MGIMGILTCLPPFQMRGAMDGEAVAAFASLGADIRSLQRSLEENELSLQWCNEAVALLKKMHAMLVVLFENAKPPLSWSGMSSNHLDEYMDESLDILELCNMLKSAASGIDRYCLMIGFALKDMQSGEDDSLSLHEIQKPELGSNKVSEIERWRNINMHNPGITKLKFKDSSFSVIYALRSAMNIISLILLYAFRCPIPKEHEKLHCLNPQLKPFMDSVKDLTSCFEQKRQMPAENLRAGFLEYDLMEKAVDELRAQLNKEMAAEEENLQASRRLVEQKSMALKAGLMVFQSEIIQLFEAAVRGRNKLIQMIMKK